MKYRSEIDGLRAIAIVPVVLFHAGFETFSGGFVGVDVFFVISGFLITTIIINEMDERKFSLAKFYERRARRILPALFFVVLCCIPAAWFLLLPDDMRDFAQSLVAVATFSSNILFWRESGYFATAAELKPLLHTWSLAVEEQFYILFPLFLMIAWRFGKRTIVWTLLSLFIISLALAHWGAYNKPTATFYLIPTRAWELLIGSFTAFYLQRNNVRISSWLGNAISSAGLAAILYSVFAFDDATPFPSLYALLPTLGTALVILFATPGTRIHKLLSLKSVVGLGLISYSLYLWHQPVFAFWRNYNVTQSTQAQMAVATLFSLLLAIFTYYAIETPFRGKSAFLNRRNVFGVSGIMLSALIAFGFIGHIKDGWNLRSGPNGIPFFDLERFLSVNPGIDMGCIGKRDISNVVNNKDCETLSTPKILLWGDSYAMHLYGMLSQNPVAKSIGIRQIAISQCMPNHQLGVNGSVTSAQECISFNNQVLRHIADSDYKYVIMSSPFNRLGRLQYDINGNSYIFEDESELAEILNETARRIESTGAQAIFVAPPPTNGSHLGDCVTGMIWKGKDVRSCDYPISDMSMVRTQVDSVLDLIEEEYSVLNLSSYLCHDNICDTSIDSVPLYRDTGHLSNLGSEIIGKQLDPFGSVIIR